MNESINDFGLFERLSSTMHDPYVDRKMHQVRATADLLNESEHTSEEKAALVAKLDADWIYRHRALIVSGELWSVSTQSNELERSTVRDLEVTSDGFMFDPDRISLEGEHIEGSLHPSFAFKIKDPKNPHIQTYAAMHFDDVDHIVYPFPSRELRNQRFRYHSPDLAADIDTAVFYARDAGDMISTIGSIIAFDRDASDENDREEVTDMQSYLNDTLNLDEELPYRLTMIGQMAVMGEGTEATIIDIAKPLRRFGLVRQIRLLAQDLKGRTDEGGQRYVPYLEVMLYESDRSTPPRHVMVPFTSILHAESIRDEA